MWVVDHVISVLMTVRKKLSVQPLICLPLLSEGGSRNSSCPEFKTFFVCFLSGIFSKGTSKTLLACAAFPGLVVDPDDQNQAVDDAPQTLGRRSADSGSSDAELCAHGLDLQWKASWRLMDCCVAGMSAPSCCVTRCVVTHCRLNTMAFGLWVQGRLPFLTCKYLRQSSEFWVRSDSPARCW